MGKDIERLVRTYAQLEMDILLDMARKLGKFDLYIPSTVYQHQKLVQMGLVYDEIVLRLSAALKKTPAEIEKIIKEAGAESLKNDLNIYEKAASETTETAEAARERPTRMRLEEVRKHIDKVISGTAAVAFEAESKAIANIINEGFRRTNGAFENLTRTTANTATRQFERALDRAYMQVSSGAFSGGRATEMAIKDLAAKGIESLVYPSGHVDTMEVAARRAIITGVNNTNLHLKDELAEQLGLNLVEVSAHAGARPSHAVWQGKIYSRKGATDKYPNLAEATGYGTGPGLGGWNCNHTMSPYYEGMPRAYTDELLEEYRAKSVEVDGEQINRYDANQKMRYLERGVRKWKREAEALEAAGLDASGAKRKAMEWQKRWKAYSEQTGIKTQGDRIFTGKTLAKATAKELTWENKNGKIDTRKRDELYLKNQYNIKASSGLPATVKLGDEALKHTLEVNFPKISGVVPNGTNLTNVVIIAGEGTKTPIKDLPRLYAQYPKAGAAEKWQKKTGIATGEYFKYEIHWYENSGFVSETEMKIKGAKKK